MLLSFLENVAPVLSIAHAQTAVDNAAGTVTLDQFNQLGNLDTSATHGAFVRPAQIPATPASSVKAATATAPQKPLPSAEPAKMKSFAYQLDSSFVRNTPKAALHSNASATTTTKIAAAAIPSGTTPLHAQGSDGRLEIDLPRGSVDLSNAAISDGSAPVGTLSVQVTQNYGHTAAERLFLGSYVIQVVDSQGHIVHGLTLTQPLTIRYHYTQQELQDMGIDPNNVLLSWPDAISAALAAKTSTAGLTTKMVNNATAQTLTAQVMTLGLSTLDVSSESANQAPPKPDTFSVSGNSGQFSYSYPLSVAPGPAGYAPQLQLSYSSSSTNERYSRRSPAGSAGDGWSVSLGSISKTSYPASSTSGAGDWYFLSGIDGVSERLVPDTELGAGWYTTQHISHLKIQMVNSNCWFVWGKSGDFYVLGCDAQYNSSDYTTDSSGTKQIYQWNLSHAVAPFKSQSQSRTIVVTYLQDTPDGGKTIRDSGIKQIRYGTEANTSDLTFSQPGDLLAGTVDFHYHAPTAQAPWADAYGNNYNCSNPPTTTTLRCDDPLAYGSVAPPAVMSTLTLDSITSYVGDDSTATHKAYSYAFTYQDTPISSQYWDTYALIQDYAAGYHLLTQIIPTVYQNGVAHPRQGMTFGYTDWRNGYYDNSHTTIDANQQYSGQTWWNYLTSYRDLDTGQGENITYMTAHNNTNGTPYAVNADGSIDDRHDPLYCDIHANDVASKQCGGIYGNSDQDAWSQQIVTQVQAIGKDSSSGALTLATTTYSYWLAKTGTGCNPITGSGVPTTPSQTDCVGDNWIPGYNGVNNTLDGDWMDYYHSEFRGFNASFITSPAGNLTATYYYSTEGWNTPESDGDNYNSGQVYEQDVYQGNHADSAHLLRQTLNNYSGVAGPFSNTNSCDGNLNPTYNPCVVEVSRTKTISYEGNGGNSSAPWVQNDYTYDDYSTASGYVYANTYHNLLQEVDSSSNAPTITKKYQYQVTNQTANGWTYYNVDKVSHSEVDDASGHVWSCQNNTYDQGSSSGTPAPAAGLVTTTTNYSNCSNTAGTALTGYTGYDQYGNVVATVDPFGVANSSVYSSSGCTLATAPTYLSSSWTAGRYTKCSVYDTTHTAGLVVQQTNALGQGSTTAYDYTQGAIASGVTDANGQTTTTGYSYDSSGNITTQVTLPGASSSYSSQAKTNSQCSGTSSLPCYETDSNSALYAGAVTRTFYDSLARKVETRTPLDSGHDVITYTVYDDANATTFTSVPFRVSSGSAWVDPATAKDENSNAITGTISYADALGRVRATKDPALGSTAEPGIACQGLTGTWSSCVIYGIGSIAGDAAVYTSMITLDANNHMVANLTDALGRSIYSLWYSAAGALTSNIIAKQTTQYNVLNKATSVTMTDLAPQTGQTTTSVTATASYDDLGRLTSMSDPDRGTHTYSYDADGRQIADTSGSRTIGSSYDLLGRVGCVQDAAAPSNDTGACSSGSHPLVQNTYDHSTLGSAGSSDFPVGQLTRSVATTYYPDGSSAVTTQQYQHDQRGRESTTSMQITLPASWNVTTALPVYQESLAYNDANQATTTQTTIAGHVGYTFSQAYDSTTGTLTGLSNNSMGVANLVSQSFDLHGMASGLTFQTIAGSSSGTLASESFSYDGDLRPASENATLQSGGASIFSTSRSYDPAGNVSSVSTTQAAVVGQSGSGGSETDNFCYDAMNRLVWAGNSGTQPSAGGGTCGTLTPSSGIAGGSYNTSYAYTNLGQLWQAPLKGQWSQLQYLYCDSSHPHQLTGLYPLGTTCANRSSATASYSTTYDAWGNATNRVIGTISAQLSYDVLDHFVQWSSTNSSTQEHVNEQYVYDASGERVLRRSQTSTGTATPTTNLIVYAFGLEEHYYSGTGSGAGDTYYYTFAGRLVGQWDDSETRYDFTDAQGSVLASMRAASGQVMGTQLYDPYGNLRTRTGALNTNKGYTGQYNDATTGLDYYNARYYDAAVARFLSADTVQGNTQGMDPYDYVGGNPETKTDPTGNYRCGPGCGEDDGDTSKVSSQPMPHPVPAVPPPVVPAAPPPPSNPWDNILGGITNAAKAVAKTALNIGDQVLGVSSMWNDLHTIFGSNASVWEKLLAGGDLVLNSAMDISMFMGAGEMARGLYALGRVGGEMVAKDLEEQVAKEGEKGLTDVLEEGCGLSFSASTSVATATGEEAIGNLKTGEKIWAYTPQTKKMELETIEHVWINHDNDLVDLTLIATVKSVDGKTIQKGEVIHTNEKHPFLTKEKGFTPVSQLKPGMHVLEANGNYGVVAKLLVVPGAMWMYNLQVAQDHTYAVGDGRWIVHNHCGAGGDGTGFGDQTKRDEHFNKHVIQQNEFAPSFADANEYENAAVDFMTQPENVDADLHEGVRSRDGATVRVNSKTGWFGIMRSDGVISTLFIPNPALNGGFSPVDYFLNQIDTLNF